MIRRRGHDVTEDPSSDEEDAFAALSQTTNSAKRSRLGPRGNSLTDDIKNEKNGMANSSLKESSVNPNSIASAQDMISSSNLPTSVTSSMKRHHKPSDTRKAKMDALLLELQEEKGKQKNRDSSHLAAQKKGSFVGPGEEKLTSN